MAAGASQPSISNGTSATAKPVQLAIPLPNNPTVQIHLHLTLYDNSLTLFLTTSSPETGSSTAANLGSYVYAMPDRYTPTQPLSTPLYTIPSTLDFATRMAKLLVRKTGKACYVSWSGDLSGAVEGGNVQEEMAAFRAVVTTVVAEVENASHNEGG